MSGCHQTIVWQSSGSCQAVVMQLSGSCQYYTPEVGGNSVWQISKKYFAGVIYGQKSYMLVLKLETFST